MSGYKGGNIAFRQMALFSMITVSFTPPHGTGARKDVTLTMTLDYNQKKNELIYHWASRVLSLVRQPRYDWADQARKTAIKSPIFIMSPKMVITLNNNPMP